MATNTYVAIETQTVTSNVTAVTFSSIPQTYTDLVVVANPACDTLRDVQIRVGNGTLDTGSNYGTQALWANTTTTGAGKNGPATYMYGNYYAGSPATVGENTRMYHFNNYSNTVSHKSVLMRSAGAALGSDVLCGTWASNSAINTISFFVLSGNFIAGSTFTLYGIANSNIGAPKAFGGTITQDATYTYHTFGSSGTFTPQQSLTCDYIVVAGGGGSGGGNSFGGTSGGGAGGYRSFTAQSLTATAYAVTIGAGGAGGAAPSSGGTAGSNGGDSTFNSATATGGGAGTTTNGASGGSGGGAYGYPDLTYSGGAGNTPSTSPSQGNTGGLGKSDNTVYTHSGGGGGAGAVGGNATTTRGGLGGDGIASSINGILTYYAGGGGGGAASNVGTSNAAGGLGGGGTGKYISGAVGDAGTPNTGGGGGGSAGGASVTGGAGGSGIVIIRYAN